MKAAHLSQSLIKLSEKASPEEACQKLLSFLEKKKLISFLPQIIFHLKKEWERRQTSKNFKLSSSHELSPETKNKIRKMAGIPAEAPEISRVDSSLIGGFVAEYEDKMYDASLKSQLKKLAGVLRK